MKRIVFLGMAGHERASVWLRSRLTADILAAHLSDAGFTVRYTTEAGGHRDAIIILNKYAAYYMPEQDIANLRLGGNIVLADHVDVKPRTEIEPWLDGLVASSHAQLKHFRETTPKIASFLIDHIVDPRIKPIEAPTDRLRIGYFGELRNTRFKEDLAEHVTFIHTPAHDLSQVDWFAQFGSYNCHYAIREPQPLDGFKPFTKGFVAARCGVPIIVSDEGDARFYLGDNYPYLVRDQSLGAARDAIAHARDDFGGPTWKAALGTMQRVNALCDDKIIVRQFSELFDYYAPRRTKSL